jgi:hypothetical protein
MVVNALFVLLESVLRNVADFSSVRNDSDFPFAHFLQELLSLLVKFDLIDPDFS